MCHTKPLQVLLHCICGLSLFLLPGCFFFVRLSQNPFSVYPSSLLFACPNNLRLPSLTLYPNCSIWSEICLIPNRSIFSSATSCSVSCLFVIHLHSSSWRLKSRKFCNQTASVRLHVDVEWPLHCNNSARATLCRLCPQQSKIFTLHVLCPFPDGCFWVTR